MEQGLMEHFLDVSLLEPPEPFEQVLDLLPDLAAGDYLRVFHRCEPFPLYTILVQQDFGWQTYFDEHDMVHIFIWRSIDKPAASAAKRAGRAGNDCGWVESQYNKT